MEQSISAFRNLKEINSITFHEVKFTGNVFLLDKNHFEGKKYTQKDAIDLSMVWYKLYDEYFENTDDYNLRKELKNNDKTLELLLKIKLMDSVIEVLESLDENKEFVPAETYLKTVASLGNNLKRVDKHIRFDSTKEIKPQLQQIQAVKGGLQTRYELLFKEDVKADKKSIMLYYDIKAHIEQTLDRNLPEIINMLQWIAYEKLYKKKLKHGREQHLRRGQSRRSN